MCLLYKSKMLRLSKEDYFDLKQGIAGIQVYLDLSAEFCSTKEVGEILRQMPPTDVLMKPYEDLLETGMLFRNIKTKYGYIAWFDDAQCRVKVKIDRRIAR